MATSSFSHAVTSGLSRRRFLGIASLGVLGLLVANGRQAFATEGVSAETSARLSNAQAQYQAAMADLQSLTTQVEMADYDLNCTQVNLDETNAKIDSLQASIEEKSAELAEKQDQLANRISANYKMGKSSILESIMGATSFEDFVNRIFYQNKISDEDAAAIQEVADLRSSLEQDQQDYQDQKVQQETLYQQQKEQAESLQSQLDSLQAYANSLSSDVVALMNQAQQEQLAAQRAAYQNYLNSTPAQTGNSENPTSTPSADGAQVPPPAPGSDSDAEVAPDAGGYDPGYTEDYGSGDYGSGDSSADYSVPHTGVVDTAWWVVSQNVEYEWGGTSLAGFDCSGLAQYCYAQNGYTIARTTYDQIAEIQAVGHWKTSMDSLNPGDLVFPHTGHVGIYVGGGMMIHAPNFGQIVQYAPVYAFIGGGSPV